MVLEVSYRVKNTFLGHFRGLNGLSSLATQKILNGLSNSYQILGGNTFYGN
jgi:hypothetical protein